MRSVWMNRPNPSQCMLSVKIVSWFQFIASQKVKRNSSGPYVALASTSWDLAHCLLVHDVLIEVVPGRTHWLRLG